MVDWVVRYPHRYRLDEGEALLDGSRRVLVDELWFRRLESDDSGAGLSAGRLRLPGEVFTMPLRES
ncbi:MAG: hypothetical protein AB1425_13440 [Actinomycetota bacterium]